MIDISKTLIFVLLLGFIILLQIFLSKSKSKLPGLVLPLLFVLISIISVLNMATFDGESWLMIAVKILVIFVISNIPSLILLAIYRVVRERSNVNNQLDKMKIQDL